MKFKQSQQLNKLKRFINTPGMKKAVKKDKFYHKRYYHFITFEKFDIVYLIFCAGFYVFHVFLKLGKIGLFMVTFAGAGIGIFILCIPMVLFLHNRFYFWHKKIIKSLKARNLANYSKHLHL